LVFICLEQDKKNPLLHFHDFPNEVEKVDYGKSKEMYKDVAAPFQQS